MNYRDKGLRSKITLLGFYCAGIIVGGGILALPFVAIDTGIFSLVLLLIVFGIIFYLIYVRLLDSISVAIKDSVVIKPGLVIYDEGLRYSGLRMFGGITFTIGLALYTIPADIVYILYGFKSLMQLSSYVSLDIFVFLLCLGFIMLLLTILLFYIVRMKTPLLNLSVYELILKLLLLTSLWIITIDVLTIFSSEEVKIIFAAAAFAFSLLIGEFFPEKLWRTRISMPIEEDVVPRHVAGAYLSIFKITLIIITPMIAFSIIVLNGYVTLDISLLPSSVESLVAATTIIVFMYVGSGIYNILIYRWIINDISLGKKAVLIAILLSFCAYIIFSLLILLSVDFNILVLSNLKREHSFIALARKLEAIGITNMGLLVITIANIFALVSVSVAFLGFTDTMSDRLALDLKVNRDLIWLGILGVITLSVIALEIFDVARIATDALGIAGNAGGGLFILILPWLMKDSKGRRRIPLAIIFIVLVTLMNISLFLASMTIVAKVASIIATILVIVLGSLVILEAIKNK